MLIDSHCHIDAAEFDADRAEVVARAKAAGVALIVVPAVASEAFTHTAAAAAEFGCCRAAYGIHPLYVEHEDPAQALAALRGRLAGGGAVAVGEIGLDRYPGHPDFARQEALFAAQLGLAREFGLPVLLHVRRAVDAVLKQLRCAGVVGGIAHAFNGSRQQAEQFIALGFRLGFGGAMSYAGSTRIRRLAAELPLSSIVLESDAPDMPPEWAPQARNEPANVARYAGILAELRAADVEEVKRASTENVLAALPGLRTG